MDGWGKADKPSVRKWHYFDGGVSLCSSQWSGTDTESPPPGVLELPACGHTRAGMVSGDYCWKCQCLQYNRGLF